MQDFRYALAHSIDEATKLLTQNGDMARVLAGGTDLLVQMRNKSRVVGLVVDIKQIPEVNELSFDSQTGLSIGAAVPCLRICDHPSVATLYPGLVDAISLIGGSQIQARATVGGNLANASPAADAIPALIVHEATCDLAGRNGFRQVTVEAFCVGPGQTILENGELLVRLHVNPPVAGFGAHYLRFTPRNEMDIAVVGAAASVVLEDDGHVFRSGRIALGAVAPTPILSRDAGDYLAGRSVSREVIEQAASLAAESASPITDVRGTASQRKHLANVLTRRALERASQRAKENLNKES